MNTFLLIIFLQVILESMPVSSSGHIAMISTFLNTHYPFISGLQFCELYQKIDYFLHGPTVIILMIVFYKQWFFPVSRLLSNTFNKDMIFKKINLYKDSYKNLLKIFFKIIKLIFVANLVTVFIWLFVRPLINKQVWFSSDITLLCGFCITMLLLFSLKKDFKVGFHINDFGKFIILGLVQGLALLPGISRFASVYATARLLQIPTRRAFEITFLVQFPLIVIASFFGFYKMTRFSEWSNIFSVPVSLSIIVATIISAIVLFWCKRLANNKKLWRFSFYMFFPISVLIFTFVF